MKKRSKAPKIDPYIDGLMAKLLERLVSLERKMDKVLTQTAGRSSGNGASQAKPQPPRHDRVLYEAICAACHKICEVPFKPTEERPVYCKECWAQRKHGGPARLPHGMPILTPVALPPKPASKLSAAALAKASARPAPAKAKKSKPAKKTKKKK